MRCGVNYSEYYTEVIFILWMCRRGGVAATLDCIGYDVCGDAGHV